MPELRILWTALPRSASAEHLELDVFVSHRLGVDAPPATALALSDFPEVLNWPAQLADHLSFDVELGARRRGRPCHSRPLDRGGRRRRLA